MANDLKAYIHPKTDNIVSAKGIILWHAVLEPRKKKGAAADPAKKGKYEFNLLFPKEANHDVVEAAALEAGKTHPKTSKAFKEADGKWPKTVKNPFKRTVDNDKLVAGLEEAGRKVEDFPMYYAARTYDKPGVVNSNGKAEGIEADHIYSGRWAKMTHDCFAGDFDGKYVTFGLKNVQLLDNDDELNIGGGRVSAESEFEAAEGAGDDSKSSDNVFD